ncbi:pentatricopeptide repeat-containing protein At3g62890-like [Aristolochia californica]|uniref:pentatricopeptide repeat-containing protein At3g62890-like n=1 Tax=Aristolochia californica TaxID=171875 RepID=UPI0035D7039B
MPSVLRHKLVSPLNASNLNPCIHMISFCTSGVNPIMQMPPEQTVSVSKLSQDLHLMKETLAHMIATHNPFSPLSFMKCIDMSLSLCRSGRFCSLLFAQHRHVLTTDLCNLVTKSYTNSNEHLKSILVYTCMNNVGILPDCATFPSVIKSVARLSCPKLGRSIHGCIIRMGFNADVFVNTALVSMYSTSRFLEDAHQLFDEMPDRNSVTWNAMITGYTHNRKFREALELFQDMQILAVEPTEVTMVSALSACAHLGALSQGKWIQNYINHNNIRLNVFVGTALIDMYAKCGCIYESEKVFQSMRMKNVYTWNALILGFAMNGQGEVALDIFSYMIKENMSPDSVTFLAVLCACCHQGLVGEGKKFFHNMEKEWGLQPNLEHYGCMVDLLGRAGFLDEALHLITNMPMKTDAVIWRALLVACRIHGNSNLSEVAIRNLLELEPYNGENYVLLSNLYSRDHRWSKVGEVRDIMNSKGIQKVPGCSSIEIDHKVYEFVVASRSEEDGFKEIYNMLDNINRVLKLSGYIADTDMVSYDIEEEEKESSLIYHSEKLALAFGLLRTSSGSEIRIVKNLRVCRDCHSFFKIVSRVYRRIVIVRDRNRFHHFGGGVCSCKDYW